MHSPTSSPDRKHTPMDGSIVTELRTARRGNFRPVTSGSCASGHLDVHMCERWPFAIVAREGESGHLVRHWWPPASEGNIPCHALAGSPKSTSSPPSPSWATPSPWYWLPRGWTSRTCSGSPAGRTYRRRHPFCRRRRRTRTTGADIYPRRRASVRWSPCLLYTSPSPRDS